ncbi:MAG: Ig-like domain-containing protein [Anaerolineae bacterium]
MIELRQPFNKLAAVLLVLYSLAHLLAAVSLVAFGLLAGGYPLNRWGIYGYAGAAATALVLSLRALRQCDDRPDALLLTLLPLLALWVTGLYATTAVLYAEFAPHLDDVKELFFALNLACALLGCWLALVYHWPRLLVVWAGGQGLLLLTNPGLWAMLLRGRFAPPLMGLWLAPLAYALTAPALGYRVPWRRVLKWLWPFTLAGVGMAAYALVTILGSEWYGEREALPWVAGLTVLGSLLTTGFTLGLPFHAWRIGRTWPGEGLARRPDRWAWVAFLVILFLMSRASAGQLRVGEGGFFALPAPMEVQRWGPAERVVPDAYLPTITWAGWLFSALRWLLIPAALLILWEAWWQQAQRPVRARARWNEFPRLLLWPALASTGIFITIYPLNMLSFVLGVAWGDQMGLLQGLSPLLTGLGLLWLYRLWEQEWSQPMRTLWTLLTAGLLALYAVWQAQALVAYGRVLFAPLPAWETRWKYAPADPTLMSAIGLILHTGLASLGLWAMLRTVQETWRPEGRFALPRQLLWRGLGLALVAITLLGAGWYWWTAPGVVRTVPLNGAKGVPRNTRILIEFRQDARPWGGGMGMRTHYADTGDYIPGSTGGGPGGMRFDPERLLRPNAPVEITVYRDGRRPYVLRFTTAGVDSPTATPLPPGEQIGPEGPVPTVPPATAEPTQDPRVTPTKTPIVIFYRPTDWPRDISAIIDCSTGVDTAEKCLSQEYPPRVQLVGYLIPAAGGFVLMRGSQRLPVSLALAEGYRRENIDWLCEHSYLTAVQGWLTSLDPPTMLLSKAHGAAHSFLVRSTPLAKLYTNPEWGIAIEYPAGWVVEPAGSSDPTAVYIQNFYSADVFAPLAGGKGVGADPSLYRVRLYPLPPEHVTTLEEARAGFPQRLKMRSMMINGLPILRFRDGVREIALVQLTDRVLTLSTRQDPALFERMLETLRPVNGK